jgi:hypothetical protein
MSASEKPSATRPEKEPYIELAEKIFIGLAQRIYSGTAEKKPDPKALAAYSFRLADAFEQASKETDRAKAATEIANKAAVTLDQVDLTSVFQSTAKPK